MLVIPAIDIKNGEAVRLYKGDYNKKTVYSKNPEELAIQFENLGADYLHIVDLDGAKDGKSTNYHTIKKIRECVSIPIEVGGGIRDVKTAEIYLEQLGVNRIILGTSALADKLYLKEMLKRYGKEKIIVGVDIKDGFVSGNGWLEISNIGYIDFIKELVNVGVGYIIVTDILKDGTLTGPSFEIYDKINRNFDIEIIVSGGIKDNEDIYKVNKLGYYGCIVGKAFYEEKVNLQEVIRCLKKE